MTFRTLALAAVASHLFASAAVAQTLEARIGGTKPGETLTLPAGYRGGGYIRGVARNPPVLVKGDPSVVLTDVKLQGSSGVVFDGMSFVASGPAPALAFTAGSHNGGARNCQVRGLKPLSGGGVSFSDSNNGFVDNCDLGDLGGGISVNRSQGASVTRNKIHDYSVDAIQFAGSNDAKVIGNEVWNSFPVPGAHNDALQFFTANTTSPTRNLIIADNIFRRGTGQVFQGVFMGNEARIPYENVTIERNTIVGGMYNGIALHMATGATIRGNTVVGFPDMTSWILTNGVTGVVENNRTQQLNVPAASPGLTVTGNTIIPAVKDGGAAILAALTTPPPAPPAPPEPIPPPPGPTPLEVAAAQIAQLTIALDAAKVALAQEQAAHAVDAAAVGAAQAALQTAQAALTAAQAQAASIAGERDAATTTAADRRAVLDQIKALASQ